MSIGRRGSVVLVGMVALLTLGTTPAGAAPGFVVSKPPPPNGTQQSELKGVACATQTTCFAVGFYVDSNHTERPLVERWMWSSWSTVALPDAPGAALNAISCPTSTMCVAVGLLNANGHDRTFVERWDGSKWSVVSTPTPPTVNPVLNGISCSSVTFCVAVGAQEGVDPPIVVEHWDGTRWSLDDAPAGESLAGVSCLSPTWCMAAGVTGGDETFVVHWNGSTWSPLPTVDPGGDANRLTSVACAAANSCFAVGTQYETTSSGSLAEHWNGASWSLSAMPGTGSTQASPNAVSCRAVNDCLAVGGAVSTGHPVLEPWGVHWNGTSWTESAVPNPTNSPYTGSLYAVGSSRQWGYMATGTRGTYAIDARYIAHAGYWTVRTDGTISGFGDAIGSATYPGRPAAIASTGSGATEGYWITDAAGHVFGGFHARPLGAAPALLAGESVTAIAGTPTTNGYWLFTNLGRVLPYGDAHSYGDLRQVHLNGPIVAVAATPSGHGYLMVGGDGGVFAFGDAQFHGSAATLHLRRPIVGLATTTGGYWLAASDGGVFSYGARFHGSLGALTLNRPVVGITPYGDGYLMVGGDGGAFDFASGEPFLGSNAGAAGATPTIGIASLED